MSSFDFSRHVTVTKGSIAYFDDASKIQKFMFNPNEINDTKASGWNPTPIPLMSHPAYQFGAGGPRVIAFQLYHCGDRGRILGNKRIPNDPGLGVEDYIQFWQSLAYPIGPQTNQVLSASSGSPTGFTFVTATPPRKVYFNFGPMWQGVVCVVTKADVKAMQFTPDLKVTRATVDIELQEAPDLLPVYSDKVFMGNAGGLY